MAGGRDRANTYRERFELLASRTTSVAARFFDTAAVGNAGVPVMGAVATCSSTAVSGA
jgi:hypothetical protein